LIAVLTGGQADAPPTKGAVHASPWIGAGAAGVHGSF
jgi:hypothetical protein